MTDAVSQPRQTARTTFARVLIICGVIATCTVLLLYSPQSNKPLPAVANDIRTALQSGDADDLAKSIQLILSGPQGINAEQWISTGYTNDYGARNNPNAFAAGRWHAAFDQALENSNLSQSKQKQLSTLLLEKLEPDLSYSLKKDSKGTLRQTINSLLLYSSSADASEVAMHTGRRQYLLEQHHLIDSKSKWFAVFTRHRKALKALPALAENLRTLLHSGNVDKLCEAIHNIRGGTDTISPKQWLSMSAPGKPGHQGNAVAAGEWLAAFDLAVEYSSLDRSKQADLVTQLIAKVPTATPVINDQNKPGNDKYFSLKWTVDKLITAEASESQTLSAIFLGRRHYARGLYEFRDAWPPFVTQ